MAKRHGMSLNELARRGLESLTGREAMAELKAAYDLIGTDSEANVEQYLAAQSEVIFDDD